MELARAKLIAERVKKTLAPYCERIEIAGSIRRNRNFVNDIDLVLIPSNQGQIAYQLQTLGKIKMGGKKLIRCEMPEIMLDVYIATPETWATLLLIRTGSAKHNIQLCSQARYRGLKLHADGSGITRNGDRIDANTEQSIFEVLGLEYKAPEYRE